MATLEGDWGGSGDVVWLEGVVGRSSFEEAGEGGSDPAADGAVGVSFALEEGRSVGWCWELSSCWCGGESVFLLDVSTVAFSWVEGQKNTSSFFPPVRTQYVYRALCQKHDASIHLPYTDKERQEQLFTLTGTFLISGDFSTVGDDICSNFALCFDTELKHPVKLHGPGPKALQPFSCSPALFIAVFTLPGSFLAALNPNRLLTVAVTIVPFVAGTAVLTSATGPLMAGAAGGRGALCRLATGMREAFGQLGVQLQLRVQQV